MVGNISGFLSLIGLLSVALFVDGNLFERGDHRSTENLSENFSNMDNLLFVAESLPPLTNTNAEGKHRKEAHEKFTKDNTEVGDNRRFLKEHGSHRHKTYQENNKDKSQINDENYYDKGVSAILRPMYELNTNCYNFPEKKFDRHNNVRFYHGSSPYLPLKEGERAIDFSLYDVHGVKHTLSEILLHNRGKPVVLLFGMYTCPAFQGLDGGSKFEECSHFYEYAMIEKYKERVQFIHIYGPEPHPITPDVNFDSGALKLNYWSTVAQPYTYLERVNHAAMIFTYLHPDTLFLVDELDGNIYDDLKMKEDEKYYYKKVTNPVWCTYGHAARPAILISNDGIIKYTQEWYHRKALEKEIEKIIS